MKKMVCLKYAATALPQSSCQLQVRLNHFGAKPPTTNPTKISLSDFAKKAGKLKPVVLENRLKLNFIKAKRRPRGKKGAFGGFGDSVKAGRSRTMQGGSVPFYRLTPKIKHPVHRALKRVYVACPVGKIQAWINLGRLDPSKTITMKHLRDSKCIRRNVKNGVKLLADGAEAVTAAFSIEVSKASLPAIEAVERVGGNVTTVYNSRLSLRALLKPHKFLTLPKTPLPRKQKDIDYYASSEKRGYLMRQTI